MIDHARAVEDAREAYWAAKDAARQAEQAQQELVVDAVFAEHKAIVGWATGLRLAVLDLHAPRRNDLEPPNCGVCFNSHGYEVTFPCPTYTVARDWVDESNERYDRAETTRRDAENEAAQLRAELTAVRHERDLLKEERW